MTQMIRSEYAKSVKYKRADNLSLCNLKPSCVKDSVVVALTS